MTNGYYSTPGAWPPQYNNGQTPQYPNGLTAPGAWPQQYRPPVVGPQPGPVPGAFQPTRQPLKGDGVRIHVPLSLARPGGFPLQQGFDPCLEALREMLERTLGTTDLAPHLHRGFKSRTRIPRTRAVINIPAAFDAAANAAGNALATATGLYEAVLNLVPTAAAPPFNAMVVLSFEVPQGHVAIFDRWGITVEVGDPTAAEVEVTVRGGPNVQSDAPDPLISTAEAGDRESVLLIVPEGKDIQVAVRNLDTAAAILVTTMLDGWVLPLRKWDNTLRSMIPQPGYGSDCGAR